MAITDKDGTVSYSERVVATKTDHDVRIMSDVWADIYYAIVYAPETMGTKPSEYEKVQETVWKTILVGNSEFPGTYKPTKVDAPKELIEEYNNYLAEVAQKALEARQVYENQLRAKAEKEALERVEKGRVVEVYKGRKVKLGTTGYVFWEGRDNFGNDKIGIATSNKKVQKPGKYGDRMFESYADVIFVAKNNCRVVGSDSKENIKKAVESFNP